MDEHVLIVDFADKTIEMVERILACADGLDEAGINWKPDAPETNSIYVLATHTMGNVRQNTLAVLGGQTDHRDRDAEFIMAGDSAAELQRQWSVLKPQVREILGGLGTADLEDVHAHPRRGTITGHQVLMLMATHAAEHAGQAELTRDLWKARG